MPRRQSTDDGFKSSLEQPLPDVTEPAECDIEVRAAAHHGDSGRRFGLPSSVRPIRMNLYAAPWLGAANKNMVKHIQQVRRSSSPQPHCQDIPRYLNQSGYSRKQPSAADWSCAFGNSCWCGPVQPVSGTEIWDGRLRREQRAPGVAPFRVYKPLSSRYTSVSAHDQQDASARLFSCHICSQLCSRSGQTKARTRRLFQLCRHTCRRHIPGWKLGCH
jgi:hypothetical protein